MRCYTCKTAQKNILKGYFAVPFHQNWIFMSFQPSIGQVKNMTVGDPSIMLTAPILMKTEFFL